jgi:hypothetical protein
MASRALRQFSALVTLAVSAAVVCGCGQAQNTTLAKAKQKIEQGQSLPKVQLQVQGRDGVREGEPVTIRVHVTQDGKPVNDADEVRFEIWRDGAPASKHAFETARRTGNGIYSAPYTFKQSGRYSVMYHVTARGTHVMAPVKVVVR